MTPEERAREICNLPCDQVEAAVTAALQAARVDGLREMREKIHSMNDTAISTPLVMRHVILRAIDLEIAALERGKEK